MYYYFFLFHRTVPYSEKANGDGPAEGYRLSANKESTQTASERLSKTTPSFNTEPYNNFGTIIRHPVNKSTTEESRTRPGPSSKTAAPSNTSATLRLPSNTSAGYAVFRTYERDTDHRATTSPTILCRQHADRLDYRSDASKGRAPLHSTAYCDHAPRPIAA